MIYCKVGDNSDVHLHFSHLGAYELGAILPDGTNYFCSVFDISTLLTKLSYLIHLHCKVPQIVIRQLNEQLEDLILEERQGH
jgi:hypothetical protein